MRLLSLFVLMTLFAGLVVRFSLQPSWLMWVGHLPGDFTIRKGTVILHIPLTSSLLATLCISLVSSLFLRDRE